MAGLHQRLASDCKQSGFDRKSILKTTFLRIGTYNEPNNLPRLPHVFSLNKRRNGAGTKRRIRGLLIIHRPSSSTGQLDKQLW